MAFEAKASFLNRLRALMAAEMTADSMNAALRLVSDALEGFDMSEKPVIDEGTDDLLGTFLVDSSSDKRPEGCPIVREVK